jgi:5-formyltetrahydrofolate cyclo-ligase
MTTVTPLEAAKAALRSEVLARRAALSPEEVVERSQRTVERVAALRAFHEAKAVLLFASFGTELRTEGLIERCLAAGQDVVLPRVIRSTRHLGLHVIHSLDEDCEPGCWGIREPVSGRCLEVGPREVDFVVVPGVALDLLGNRLGYGGGFYDRLLAEVRPDLWPDCIAALAFECQIVAEVPHQEKDLPVPLIITEERVLRTPASRPAERGS